MPAASDQLGALRLRLRRFTRRRRRPLAALLTALAAVIALTSLRPSSPQSVSATEPTPMSAALTPGEVAVPIVLPNAAFARTVARGQVVDIARVPHDESRAASIVVEGARIIEIPDGGSAFSATAAPVVVVAVRESDALALVTTSSRDTVALLIRRSVESR